MNSAAVLLVSCMSSCILSCSQSVMCGSKTKTCKNIHSSMSCLVCIVAMFLIIFRRGSNN